jgi:hypothetical protein
MILGDYKNPAIFINTRLGPVGILREEPETTFAFDADVTIGGQLRKHLGELEALPYPVIDCAVHVLYRHGTTQFMVYPRINIIVYLTSA